jgi:hypothetical protein
MDYLTIWSLLAGVLSALLGSVVALLFVRTRAGERESRLVLEEISLRETQLKYESAISAQSRRVAIELVWATLRALEELEDEEAVRASAKLRDSVRRLRGLQYEQLEALLNSFDEDRGEEDLGRLRELSSERRTELDALPGHGMEAGNRD